MTVTELVLQSALFEIGADRETSIHFFLHCVNKHDKTWLKASEMLGIPHTIGRSGSAT